MHPAVVAPLLSGNAPFGGVAYPYGVPSSQSQTNLQTNPPSTYNGDTISYSLPRSPASQAANSGVRPVGPTDAEAKVLDRTRIRQALRNVLIFAATFSCVMLFVAPIILELLETRGKARSNLLHEDFKLALRNAQRTADDPALKWVRRWEAEYVDPVLTEHIASVMLEDWEAFQKADRELVSARKDHRDLKAVSAKRQAALKKIEDWEIPFHHLDPNDPKSEVKLSRSNQQLFASVSPEIGRRITILYFDVLDNLQNSARRRDTFLDGDTFRLMQFNAQRYFMASLKERGRAPIDASLRLQPTRSNSRANEYRTKLVPLYQAGLRRFSELAR
jgi:hypothetical protein